MDFSAAEKGVKFCMRLGLLSGQIFSPFRELWLAGSHGGDISSGMSIERCRSSYIEIAVGHWEPGAAALLEAVWWDLRLASLLTHLFSFLSYENALHLCVRAKHRKSLLNVIIVLALNIYTLLTGGWITLLFQHIRFRDIELLLVCLHYFHIVC